MTARDKLKYVIQDAKYQWILEALKFEKQHDLQHQKCCCECRFCATDDTGRAAIDEEGRCTCVHPDRVRDLPKGYDIRGNVHCCEVCNAFENVNSQNRNVLYL